MTPFRSTRSRLFPVAMFLLLLTLVIGGVGGIASAAEVIPPAPAKYFNDYANKITSATALELNQTLEQFEKDTSNQIRVAIYPKMQSDSSIEDYTQRVAQSWRVGENKTNNGTVLFVFVKDQTAYIQVGYGLEGALPDATCKRLIDDTMIPLFKADNYDAALTAGVVGILAATKDEFKGTGKTHADVSDGDIILGLSCCVGPFVLMGILLLIVHNFGGTFYQRHVRSISIVENIYMFSLNIVFALLSSGSSSSGGSSGSASSGGGSFGGGGAGGKW